MSLNKDAVRTILHSHSSSCIVSFLKKQKHSNFSPNKAILSGINIIIVAKRAFTPRFVFNDFQSL